MVVLGPTIQFQYDGKIVDVNELETIVQDAITRDTVEGLYCDLLTVAEKQRQLLPGETNQEWYDRREVFGLLGIPSTYPEELAKLSGAITKLEEYMRTQGSLRSCVLTTAKNDLDLVVPLTEQLFLVGALPGETFSYTVVGNLHGRLSHCITFGHTPVDSMMQSLGSKAVYEVERIPRWFANNNCDRRFCMYLLTRYASIKREIVRNNLQGYPIRYGVNAN